MFMNTIEDGANLINYDDYLMQILPKDVEGNTDKHEFLRAAFAKEGGLGAKFEAEME